MSSKRSAYNELVEYLSHEDDTSGGGDDFIDDGPRSPVLAYNSTLSTRRTLLDSEVGRLGPVDRSDGSCLRRNSINNNTSNNYSNYNSSYSNNGGNNHSSSNNILNNSNSNINIFTRGNMNDTNVMSTSLVVDSSRKKYADVKLEIENFIDQLEAYKSFRLHQMREFKKLNELGLDDKSYLDPTCDDDENDGDEDDEELARLIQALTKKGKLKDFGSTNRIIRRSNQENIDDSNSTDSQNNNNNSNHNHQNTNSNSSHNNHSNYNNHNPSDVQSNPLKAPYGDSRQKELQADHAPFAKWLISAIEKTEKSDTRKASTSSMSSLREGGTADTSQILSSALGFS